MYLLNKSELQYHEIYKQWNIYCYEENISRHLENLALDELAVLPIFHRGYNMVIMKNKGCWVAFIKV